MMDNLPVSNEGDGLEETDADRRTVRGQPVHEPSVGQYDAVVVEHVFCQSRNEGADVQQGCTNQHGEGHGVLQPETCATGQERHLFSHADMIAEQRREACMSGLA